MPLALESGRLAYRAGLKPKDCPLAPGSAARSWWLRGYKEEKRRAEESQCDESE